MTGPDNNTNFYDGIEACRPGSEDLRMPELSDVAEAVAKDTTIEQRYLDVQRSDATLGAAFREVVAPSDLEARLLAALEDEFSAEPAVTPAAPQPSIPRRSRRVWVLGAVAASLLIALGVGATVWSWPSPVDEATWVATASDLHSNLPSEWTTGERGPADHPAYERLQRGVTVQAWAVVNSRYDRKAVIYRLRHAHSGSATLFVFRPGDIDANLPLAPPVEPSQRNSRVTTGVWTSGELVYALVVDGGRDQYRNFIRSNSVAWLIKSLTSLA